MGVNPTMEKIQDNKYLTSDGSKQWEKGIILSSIHV